YNWGETDINLDNSLFEEIFKTFDEFNFTIKEDEPLEKEVAVDPEMLGKVFENLLDVEDRKSKGAFYTPREIVHYMCQQSLINYLETNIDIPRKDLEFFIQKGDLALEYLRRQEIGRGVKEEFVLPNLIKKNAKELDRLLTEIKICDPAVGSGAFPVGMMNEIIKARTILSYLLKISKTDYELKRETIENSLYGVDTEPSAVEITKLRFWLSLIVDEEDMNNIKPLPNLENKIMCGNSLIEEFEGIKLYIDPTEIRERKDKQATLDQSIDKKVKRSEQKLKELRLKQKEFFDVENRTQKNRLKEEIDKIEWEFIEETLKEQGDGENMKKLEQYKKNKSKPFFLWKLYFSDVFHRSNPGFDVVLGNPPYIDYRKIDETTRKGLSNFESYKLTKMGSIYIYFIEFGMSLLKGNGTLVYINPYQYLSADSGFGIRKLLIDNYIIKRIVDVSHIKVFAEASAYTCINFFIKDYKKGNSIEIIRCKDLEDLNNVGFLINQDEIKSENYRINIIGYNKILSKISLVEENLGNFCKIFCGTSSTEVGKKVIDEKTYEQINSKEKREYSFFVQSSNIFKYFLKNLNKYVPKKAYPSHINDYFSQEKIFFARMTKEIRCVYTKDFYSGGKINVLVEFKINPKYLMSLLNSKLISYWYYNKFEARHLSGGYLGFDIPSIKEIPIKTISHEKQKPFVEIVDKIL
ncbi:MAG TPA: N-6 DNA methylase, partial [Candidatus Paceibacterota bacterium]|nr:N-6 DNA methylase [Candidatus Paceibacterota bacterium]